MPSIEHRFGTCDVIACVRLRGDQPHRVRGVAAVASQTGRAHLSVRVAGTLVYLEDRAALDALLRRVRNAETLARDVLVKIEVCLEGSRSQGWPAIEARRGTRSASARPAAGSS